MAAHNASLKAGGIPKLGILVGGMNRAQGCDGPPVRVSRSYGSNELGIRAVVGLSRLGIAQQDDAPGSVGAKRRACSQRPSRRCLYGIET